MKWFFSLVLLVITADHLTKKMAVAFLRDAAQSIVIIPGLFSFTYAENKGVAFGLDLGRARGYCDGDLALFEKDDLRVFIDAVVGNSFAGFS